MSGILLGDSARDQFGGLASDFRMGIPLEVSAEDSTRDSLRGFYRTFPRKILPGVLTGNFARYSFWWFCQGFSLETSEKISVWVCRQEFPLAVLPGNS